MKKTNFTLIEMLTVIGIIAILAAILFPTINIIMTKAKENKAKTQMNAIKTAIMMYYTDYGLYPSHEDLTDETNYRNLMEYLICADGPGAVTSQEYNPRKKRYLDAPSNYTNDSDALGTGEADVGDYADPWGNRYRIFVDKNYDGTVDSTDNSALGANSLVGSIFIYSFGKNGTDDSFIAGTDDLCSWK
jgi:prepilin-type N-terminal cleavage/methylation domain-containing protein